MAPLPRLFGFPDPVNETSARVVAGGVLTMATATIAFDQPWLLLPLTYGFAARVATGPTLSPLGQLATGVVTPRLPGPHRTSPGAPKRLAQGMGLAITATSAALYYGFGRRRAAYRVLGLLVVAAGLEAGFGICLACRLFPLLIRAGLVPERVCRDCAAIWSRPVSLPETPPSPADAAPLRPAAGPAVHAAAVPGPADAR